MILKEFLQAWRDQSPISRMLEEFISMIEDVEWLYDSVGSVIRGKLEPKKIEEEIYERDREVNRKQRDIRRLVVNHLTVQPGVDVPICLVLISIVKDAERLGDHCKDIFEVAMQYTHAFDREQYTPVMDELDEDITVMFSQMRKAFARSDKKLAWSVIEKDRVVSKQCDMLVRQLANDNDLKSIEAVSYTLLTRFYKRVSRHIANIATSVTSSVENLDYRYDPSDPTDSGPPNQ